MTKLREEASRRGEGGSDRLLVAVELEFPPGRSYRTVGRLVAAGVATRLELSVDRVEELQLAIDTALRQPPADDHLLLTLTPTEDDLRVRTGPFVADGAGRNGVERVLSALVDELEIHESERDAWIDMRVSRRDPAPASR